MYFFDSTGIKYGCLATSIRQNLFEKFSRIALLPRTQFDSEFRQF